MSRRITWVAISSGICVALAIMVYSMQPTSEKNDGGAGPSPVLSRPAATNVRQAGNTKEPAKDPGAQKVLCSLNGDQSPVVRGLKLGMNAKQVLAVFPGSSEDPEVLADSSKPPSTFGETRFIIKPDKYGSKENFVGIRSLTFGFLDGRLSDFNVGYDGPKWKHVDEFVTKFIDGTNLPAMDAWESQVGMDTQLKSLKCDGFEITVFAGGKTGNLNYVQLRDVAAEKELEARRTKATEKAGKGAKP